MPNHVVKMSFLAAALTAALAGSAYAGGSETDPASPAGSFRSDMAVPDAPGGETAARPHFHWHGCMHHHRDRR